MPLAATHSRPCSSRSSGSDGTEDIPPSPASSRLCRASIPGEEGPYAVRRSEKGRRRSRPPSSTTVRIENVATPFRADRLRGRSSRVDAPDAEEHPKALSPSADSGCAALVGNEINTLPESASVEQAGWALCKLRAECQLLDLAAGGDAAWPAEIARRRVEGLEELVEAVKNRTASDIGKLHAGIAELREAVRMSQAPTLPGVTSGRSQGLLGDTHGSPSYITVTVKLDDCEQALTAVSEELSKALPLKFATVQGVNQRMTKLSDEVDLLRQQSELDRTLRGGEAACDSGALVDGVRGVLQETMRQWHEEQRSRQANLRDELRAEAKATMEAVTAKLRREVQDIVARLQPERSTCNGSSGAGNLNNSLGSCTTLDIECLREEFHGRMSALEARLNPDGSLAGVVERCETSAQQACQLLASVTAANSGMTRSLDKWTKQLREELHAEWQSKESRLLVEQQKVWDGQKTMLASAMSQQDQDHSQEILRLDALEATVGSVRRGLEQHRVCIASLCRDLRTAIAEEHRLPTLDAANWLDKDFQAHEPSQASPSISIAMGAAVEDRPPVHKARIAQQPLGVSASPLPRRTSPSAMRMRRDGDSQAGGDDRQVLQHILTGFSARACSAFNGRAASPQRWQAVSPTRQQVLLAHGAVTTSPRQSPWQPLVATSPACT
mmetsp:Transcript_21479/g.39379  ORF Transcript_21479/g.39379 Transcript_21479/m.39379 type:complete len:670 (-) Transcript_21479:112-2121(-)